MTSQQQFDRQEERIESARQNEGFPLFWIDPSLGGTVNAVRRLKHYFKLTDGDVSASGHGDILLHKEMDTPRKLAMVGWLRGYSEGLFDGSSTDGE